MAVATVQVTSEVMDERKRQDAKWGQQDHHPMEWLSILLEEVGEVARAANEAHWHADQHTYAQYRKELLEVAAVAVAAVECLDRNGPPK